MKVIPNNVLRRDNGASQLTTPKRSHLTKVLQGSYQQGKGPLKACATNARVKTCRSGVICGAMGRLGNMRVAHNSITDSNAE